MIAEQCTAFDTFAQNGMSIIILLFILTANGFYPVAVVIQ
jgi:hypothetical protein